jgi:DNA-binding IscR family transcriptional regulator
MACSVRAHWPLVNEAMRGALASISLPRLMGPNLAGTQLLEMVS